MDFRTCNYEQMKEEWDENKKIMWEAPGKPTNKNGEWTVENTMAKSLKKGDVVYFYVTNLPSESNVKLSRIMLRGKIEDVLWSSFFVTPQPNFCHRSHTTP